MSYQITIGGHTRNEHNAQIKAIAEEAWAKAKALHDADELAPTLTGWSGDQSGSISLATPQQERPETATATNTTATPTEPTPGDSP